MSTLMPFCRSSDAACVTRFAVSSRLRPVSFDSALRTASILETKLLVIGRLRISSTRRAQVCAKKCPRNSSPCIPSRSARLASVTMRCTTPSIDNLVRLASASTAATPACNDESGSPSISKMRRAPCSISNREKFCSSLIVNVGASNTVSSNSFF